MNPDLLWLLTVVVLPVVGALLVAAVGARVERRDYAAMRARRNGGAA